MATTGRVQTYINRIRDLNKRECAQAYLYFRTVGGNEPQGRGVSEMAKSSVRQNIRLELDIAARVS